MPSPADCQANSITDLIRLSSRFCAMFRGVCADCPHHASGPRRRKGKVAPEALLPPHALGAIASLVRCRKLTQREQHVLTLCCSGLKNDAIASALGISRSAVRRHLRHLHEKTNTSDKAELILNLWHSSGECRDYIEPRKAAGPRHSRRGPATRARKRPDWSALVPF
jgi:DNA-binding CsgD family transcriptional regulator